MSTVYQSNKWLSDYLAPGWTMQILNYLFTNALLSLLSCFFLIWLVTGCALSSLISSFLSLPTQDGGKEVLSMHQILLYLLRCSKALVPEEEIANMLQWEELEWQKYAEECKGMIVTNPGTVGSGAHTPGPGHPPSRCECFRKTTAAFSKLYPSVVFIYLVDTKNITV